MIWFCVNAWLFAVVWVAFLFAYAAASPGSENASLLNDKKRLLVLLTGTLLAAVPQLHAPQLQENVAKKPRIGHPHRRRKRRSVESIMDELGPTYARRACRMERESFFTLYSLIKPHLVSPSSSEDTKLKGAKNGLIPGETRHSTAIRYFAGGRPEDICIVHGVSHSEVFNSVWKVVNAVNMCPDLAFQYPSSHEAQREIAQGFFARSYPGFACCAGAIDGMLIWIEKPSDEQCARAAVGPKKWYCGRKKKFGIALQGTCDVEGRLLDVVMEHPALTSDFLAFATSPLYHQMETGNFLAPGLCLFGDNAYVNCPYMATPYRQSTVGTPEDNYNYFHSQVSSTI